jgi:hypothetical protein
MEGTMDVFGYEYETGEEALGVFKRAEALVTQRTGASVWRTQNLDRTRWFVLVADAGCGLRERVEWAPGVEYEVPVAVREGLIERFLRTLAEGYDPLTGKSHTDNHWDRGAHLHRGGRLEEAR